ncbi:MAG: FUSC family protein, partial [Bdellovibrio sp.]
NAWSICVAIIILQFVIEMLIVRHYALAVVFITPMTILLTEAGNPLIHNPEVLVPIRFWNIALGSLIGAIGGWVIYNERIRFIAKGRERLQSNHL